MKKVKRYEITVSKCVYHLIDEFDSEEEARAHAIKMRDTLAKVHGSFGKRVFYDLEEVTSE
jgi:hypothetical protein